MLTFADLAGELPYETEIVSVLMPGAVLEAAIAWSRNGVNDAEPSGAFLQCDNGLCCKQRGKDRWVIESVRGEVFNPSRAYLVALPYHTLHGLDKVCERVPGNKASCLINEVYSKNVRVASLE